MDTSPGEVWHIEASKPITVMAGYPENDEYEEVKSPYPTDYYFTLIGDYPYVVVEAQEDNTHVTIDNLDGSSGDWSGTLNAGGKIVRHIPYTRSGNRIEWVRVHVYSDKPIEVLNADPGNFGASHHDFLDWINNALGNYRLYLIGVTPSDVRLSGNVGWSGSIAREGSKIIQWIGSWDSIHIESTGYLAIYTLANGWSEGITPIYPVVNIEPGGYESFTIPLPSNTDVYTAHTLTLEIYFIDGSMKEYSLGVRSA